MKLEPNMINSIFVVNVSNDPQQVLGYCIISFKNADNLKKSLPKMIDLHLKTPSLIFHSNTEIALFFTQDKKYLPMLKDWSQRFLTRLQRHNNKKLIPLESSTLLSFHYKNLLRCQENLLKFGEFNRPRTMEEMLHDGPDGNLEDFKMEYACCPAERAPHNAYCNFYIPGLELENSELVTGYCLFHTKTLGKVVVVFADRHSEIMTEKQFKVIFEKQGKELKKRYIPFTYEHGIVSRASSNPPIQPIPKKHEKDK